MGQFLAHLIGDYLLQTDRMAKLKTSDIRWALFHGAAYTLPFLLLTRSPLALLVICLSHALIDRYDMAIHFVNGRTTLANRFASASAPVTVCHPLWLIKVIDNTLHLCINFLALAYL